MRAKADDPVSAASCLDCVRTTGDRKGGAPELRAKLGVSNNIVLLQEQRRESPGAPFSAQRLSVTVNSFHRFANLRH
jgi:hypothetical protein